MEWRHQLRGQVRILTHQPSSTFARIMTWLGKHHLLNISNWINMVKYGYKKKYIMVKYISLHIATYLCSACSLFASRSLYIINLDFGPNYLSQFFLTGLLHPFVRSSVRPFVRSSVCPSKNVKIFVWSSHVHKMPLQIQASSLFYLIHVLYH